MKKLMCVAAVAVGIFFGMSLNAGAAGTGKMGVVDLNGAMANSQWGKKITEQIRREQDKLSGDVEQKGKTLKTASEEFDKKKDVMDEKARNKKQKELQDMYADLQKQLNESNQQLNKMRQEALNPLFQKVNEIIQKIGKDDKYDFIFDKAAVPFASDQNDLTKRVTAELDKSSPK